MGPVVRVEAQVGDDVVIHRGVLSEKKATYQAGKPTKR
jgi:serine acetyltransferase